MNQYKNSMHHAESKRNAYVLLCVVALVALLGYGALSVVDSMLGEQPHTAFVNTKEVGTIGHTKYRFRALYNGPSMSGNYGDRQKTLPTVANPYMTSSYSGSGAGSAAYSQNGALAVPSASASGTGLSVSSSASQHSYGGGAAYSTGGNMSVSATSSPLQGTLAMAPTPVFRSTSINRKSYAASDLTDDAAFLTSGPRRIGGDDGEFGGDGDGTDVPEVGVETSPVGDIPLLALALLLTAYVIYRKKKSRPA